MNHPAAITDRAADLEAIADQIRRDAIYADGPAHTQDMDRAAELDRQAAALRRAALPLHERCRPVRMVPVRRQSQWALTYSRLIERAEIAGNQVQAKLLRQMRDQYARSNPGAFAEHVYWEVR